MSTVRIETFSKRAGWLICSSIRSKKKYINGSVYPSTILLLLYTKQRHHHLAGVRTVGIHSNNNNTYAHNIIIHNTIWRVKTAMATIALCRRESRNIYTHTRKPIARSDYWRDVHAKAKPIDRSLSCVCVCVCHANIFTRTHTHTHILRNYITHSYALLLLLLLLL